MSRMWIVLLLSVLANLAPSHVTAQDYQRPAATPSRPELARARELYLAGNAAADAGQLDDALERFIESYGLSGNPAALYNVARTLRALGRHVEATAAFDQLLADHPEVSEQTREEASALRDEEGGRIVTLVLTDLPEPTEGLVLRLDGIERLDSGERPLALTLDPGSHGLVAMLTGHRPFAWEDELPDGSRRVVSVRFEPEPTGRPLIEEPLLWVGVAIVVLAGAAIGAWAAWDGAQLRPESPEVIRL